eukprot:4122337-Pleurochrysis_carterae.AAC.1
MATEVSLLHKLINVPVRGDPFADGGGGGGSDDDDDDAPAQSSTRCQGKNRVRGHVQHVRDQAARDGRVLRQAELLLAQHEREVSSARCKLISLKEKIGINPDRNLPEHDNDKSGHARSVQSTRERKLMESILSPGR